MRRSWIIIILYLFIISCNREPNKSFINKINLYEKYFGDYVIKLPGSYLLYKNIVNGRSEFNIPDILDFNWSVYKDSINGLAIGVIPMAFVSKKIFDYECDLLLVPKEFVTDTLIPYYPNSKDYVMNSLIMLFKHSDWDKSMNNFEIEEIGYNCDINTYVYTRKIFVNRVFCENIGDKKVKVEIGFYFRIYHSNKDLQYIMENLYEKDVFLFKEPKLDCS